MNGETYKHTEKKATQGQPQSGCKDKQSREWPQEGNTKSSILLTMVFWVSTIKQPGSLVIKAVEPWHLPCIFQKEASIPEDLYIPEVSFLLGIMAFISPIPPYVDFIARKRGGPMPRCGLSTGSKTSLTGSCCTTSGRWALLVAERSLFGWIGGWRGERTNDRF